MYCITLNLFFTEKGILKMLLEGKVALVTGAGRGLGWGVARALGRAGAQVCATDINPDELIRAGLDLKADGSVLWTQHLDVADLTAFVARQARQANYPD